MPFGGDPLAFYGKKIIEDYDAFLLANIPPPRDQKSNYDFLSTEPDQEPDDEKLCFLPDKKVGILGAGVSGLYAALLLDSLDIEFEILEASDHVGGRLSTYRFEKGQKYDYYDAGAMRYPLPKKDEQGLYKNGIMARLADLIDYLHLEDKLIPYYFEARKHPGDESGFYYFNGVRRRISETPVPPDFKDTGVDPCYIKVGTEAITKDVVANFTRMIIEDIKHGTEEGWQMLKENDSYSVRAYMTFKYIPSAHLGLPLQHLSTKVVNWCEHMENSTKSYDRALAEEVFESLAFARVDDRDFSDVDWRCFDGGSVVLPKKMVEVVDKKKKDRIHFGRRVTAIRQACDLVITVASDYPTGKLPDGATETIVGDTKEITVPKAGVEVSVGKNDSHVYSHVISTLPLPVLRTIDMRDAGMLVQQKNALRQFQYGSSVKIAILFREPWWTTRLHIVGGQSFTDLPIRTIVYPSYGVDSNTPSTVLIASYSWTADAERLGALAMKEKKEELKELVLRNLAEAHANGITYEFLDSQYVDMNVKDWSRDAETMGAFAQFGPGDFQDLYQLLNFPAAGKRLYFAGEAISTRHAWVVGALDSAWAAVREYLRLTKQMDKLNRFGELWGEDRGWAGPPKQLKDDYRTLVDEHLGVMQMAIPAGLVHY